MINSVVRYLQDSVECFPDKVAFSDKEKSLSFFELDRKARSLACEINKKLNGTTKQPIGVYLPKNVDSIVAFLATVYSGNFYTPLDIFMPIERLEKITNTLKPSLIITNCEKENVVKLISPNSAILATISDNQIDDALIDKLVSSVIDTDILYVMFTSGSTGEPKGVSISHRAVIDYIEWLSDTFDFDQDTVFGNQAPFYFDNSVLDIYSTIKNGCKMVIIPEEKFLSAKRLCSFIDESSINTIFWVPSALCLVANSGILENNAPKSLTKILFAGEVMPVKQLNIWRHFIPNALYANLYGPTEIAVDCTYYIVNRKFEDNEILPIGFPCANTGILILNDKNEPVAVDEVGELCVRGSCLSHGYYGNAEKTNQVFVQNPLNNKYPEIIYKTGDLAKYNDRGEIIYIGRKDFQIKHLGYRIELGEIETVTSAFVEQCCAMYDKDKKRIILAVAPDNIDKKELYANLKKLLPKYMLPELILAEKLLPLNQNGKINRHVLLEKAKEK